MANGGEIIAAIFPDDTVPVGSERQRLSLAQSSGTRFQNLQGSSVG
jgi:hypothetical protein